MYLLVKCNPDVVTSDPGDIPRPTVDPVVLCKKIEELAGVEVVVIVRDNAERYDSDHYIMTANTTELARLRLAGEEDNSYGYLG